MNNELIGVISSEGELVGELDNKGLSIDVTIVGTGEQGKTGKSAYQEWLDLGNIGSEEDFILSLKGKAGYTPQKDIDYFDGSDGEQGLSAYEVWLSEGNIGTVEDYLNSLKGSDAEVTNANVINALGYTPANATNEHTHSNKTVIDKFTEVENKPYYNGEEIGGAVPNLTLNELILGGRFKLVYNDIEDSLDIEVI